MEYKTDAVLDIRGNAIFNASVRVLTASKELATIYDVNGNQVNNPLGTDATGEFSVAVPNGKYFYEISVNGKVYETRGPISFFDSMDNGAASIGYGNRTVSDKFGEEVSILDLMTQSQREAVIDGAYAAGMADAIQAVYDAHPKDAIFHPPGTYLVDKTLVVPPNAVLIGSGKASVIKQASGANLNAVLQSGVAGGERTNVRILNLHIDGNKAGNPTGATHGILLYRPRYAWIDLCEVVNARGDGIRMETESGDFENYVRNCRVYGAGGRNVAITGLGTDCHVRGGNYGYSVGAPIFLSTASSSVNDATIWGGNLSAYGVELYGVSCQIRNNEIEGCTKDGILVSSYARHTFIEGNKLYANSFSSANSGLYGGCTVEAGAGPGTFVANRVYAALSGGAAAYNQGYALKFSGAHDVWEVAANSMIWTGASASGTEATTAVVVGLLATDKTDALWSKSRISVGLASNLSAPGLNNWLPFPLANEIEDGWGEWDTAAYTFTPKESGRYRISGIVTADPDAIGSQIGFRLYRTSGTAAEVARLAFVTASDGSATGIPLRTYETFLAAGGTYRVEYFLTGATTTVLAGSIFTNIQIQRVPQ